MRIEKLADGFRIAGAAGTTSPILLEAGPAGEMLLVSVCEEGLCRWAVDSGEMLWCNPTGAYCAMDYTAVCGAQGQWVLAAATDEGIYRWDARTGAELPDRDPRGDPLWGVAGARLPDGRTVLVGAGNGGVYRWDAITGEPIGAPLLPDQIGRSAATGVLGDGTPLLVCGDEGGRVHRWHLGTGQPLGAMQATSPSDFTQVATLALDGGRTLIVAGGLHDDVMCRWDADTGEPIGDPIEAGAGVVILSAVQLAGEPVLITSGDDDIVRRWHAVTGELLDASMAGVAATCAMRADGTVLLATGTCNGDLALHHLGHVQGNRLN